MLAGVYDVATTAGLAVAIFAMIHYSFISYKERSAEAAEVAKALQNRQKGIWAPLPEHRVFHPGTISGALGLAFIFDSIASWAVGVWELENNVRHAAVATLVAGGVQYAVTRLRRDRTPSVWPNSPWLCWLVASALGLLGGVAEATPR